MVAVKVTKQTLEEVIRMALRFYQEDNAYHCDLDDKQFMAQCYLKACIRVLKTPGDFEFPKRADTTGFGDSNG